jgi:hypothetical protein
MSYIEPIELGGKQLTPRHAEALRLAADGIPVFPCRLDKTPATQNGFKDESTDIARIDHWWSQNDWNIGVRPWNMKLVALDLDLNKPGGVSQAFRDLLPQTLTHRTQSGNLHQFYRASEPFGNDAIAQNVDVRCANGYVLWPPSHGYEVLDTSEPAALPEAIANTLRGKNEPRDEDNDCPDIGFDVDIDGARIYLANLSVHPGRFQLACALVRNFGLSNHTATALCLEYGIRIESVSSGQSWETKLAHARKHGTGQLGEGVAYQQPEDDGRADTFDGFVTEIRKSRFTRRTMAEAANKPPIAYWDKHKTLPNIPCVGLVYGGHGSHKTGLFIKHGLDILEQGGRVLYVATEDSYGVDVARLPAAVAARGWDLDKYADSWWTVEEGFNLLGPGEHQAIADACGDWRPSLVVFDVLTKAFAGDINSPEIGAGIMLALGRLALRFKCAVVAGHHPGKDAERGMLGSVLLSHLADFVWQVRHDRGTVFLTVDKLKNGPADRTIKFSVAPDRDGVPVLTDCAEDGTFDGKGENPFAQKVRNFLDNIPEALPSADAFAARLRDNAPWCSDQSLGAIAKMLTRMVDKGELVDYASRHGRNYVFSRPNAGI